ncbi:MAG: hypothetical protein ACOX59_02890 [Bacteroidales bacterium]|jgi:hypothetical protein|nr:hypothetical protein [Bacteroidales bacterium]MBP8981625.1 hypothetical protein [Bacteroidales bacterium]NLV39433.1 hypothetical protein [Bacteroidales bacterium]HNZ80503.1 hypothetical protein [Bacteroidales bacterium]HOD26881.1 hypothetical protein [Bacteroidales bacterium]
MEKRQKELNLSELLMLLFKGIGNLIKWLWNLFIQALRLSYRKKWIILGFIVAGLVWGYFASTPDKQIHKASITLKTVIKGSPYSKDFIKTLNADCGKKDKSSLAKKLNISEEEAEKIVSLKSFYLVDIGADGILDQVDYKESFKGDTINVWSNNFLYVEILSKDEKLFPTIREGIVYALNNDSSVQKEKAFMNLEHSDWVSMLDEELEKVKELQSKMFAEDVSNVTSLSLRQKPKQQWSDPNVMTVLGETKMQMFAGDKIHSMVIMNNHKRAIKELNEGAIRVELPILYLGVTNPRYKVMITRAFIAYLLGLGLCAYLENRKKIIAFLEA